VECITAGPAFEWTCSDTSRSPSRSWGALSQPAPSRSGYAARQQGLSSEGRRSSSWTQVCLEKNAKNEAKP